MSAPQDTIASPRISPVQTAPVQMSSLHWVMLIALSILWGGSFFFTKVAVGELSPLDLIFLRVLIAALALHVVLRLKGIAFPFRPAAFAPFVVMGMINNVVPFGLLTWGQTEIASGLASILNAFTPISTVVILHLFTITDRATPLKVAGVVLGFAGVAVMIGAEALTGAGDHVVAELACLGATISYGFAGLYGRRFRETPALVTATGQLTGSSLILLPVVALSGAGFLGNAPSASVTASMLALGLLSTALAYILFFRILAEAGPANVMLVTFLVPVSAILAGALVLGEVLEPRHWIGMIIIAAALVTIDGRIPTLVLRRSGSTREPV